MPLYLVGKLFEDSICWTRAVDSNGTGDRTLVMAMDAALFSVLPGLRSARDGWVVDINRLRVSLPYEPWLPRRGTYQSTVRSGVMTGYLVTLVFTDEAVDS